MAEKHAILSASSSHRWLECTPSARLEQEFAETNTQASMEGIAAHELGAHKIMKKLHMRSDRPISEYNNDEYGIYLQTVERISGKPGNRWINWAPYIRLLADKPAAIYNFSFLDLFKDNEYIIEQITKLESKELKTFLLTFANMIDDKGLDKAIEKVDTLL